MGKIQQFPGLNNLVPKMSSIKGMGSFMHMAEKMNVGLDKVMKVVNVVQNPTQVVGIVANKMGGNIGKVLNIAKGI